MKREKANIRKIFILLGLLIFLFFLSLTLGRYSIGIVDVFKLIIGKTLGKDMNYSKLINTVILQVRLPRVISAIIIGASLSISGAVYQGMFKNPMVSPDILGTSAGAGFGASLAILLSLSVLGTQVLSFTFGLLAVLLTYGLTCKIGKNNDFIFILILAGMLVGTSFQSLISISKYMADPYDKLPTITFWLMGSLASIGKRDVLMLLFPFLLGSLPLFLVRWHLNTLSFGEEEAKAMGVETKRLRALVILSSTVLTASAVSISGMIGWVGLIVPHMARILVGPDFKYLLPTSAIMGGIYLLVVDNLARALTSVEIPLGILTSLIGAPFFIYLLYNSRKGWN